MTNKHLFQNGGIKMSKGTSNTTVKILALFISIFLWSYVMSEVNPEITREYRNISVNINNMSSLERKGLVIMEPSDPRINVRITGKKSEIDRFTASNISAQVDLSGYDEGVSRVPVSISLVNNYSNVKITNIEPSEILFTIDKLITREMPIRVNTVGELGEDLAMGDFSLSPQTVLVTGPRSWVNEVSQAVASIDISERVTNISGTLPIQLLDDNGNEVSGLDREPTIVNINIPIFRRNTVPIELQTTNQLPEDYIIREIRIEPGEVAIRGDNKVLGIEKINTKPIDINKLLEGNSMEVELDLPEGIELLNEDEKVYIHYTIEKLESKEFVFDTADISIENLSEDLEVENIEPFNILINIKAFKEDIEEISKKDISLYLDLEEKREGIHELPVDIRVTEDKRIQKIKGGKINISLVEKINQ